MMPMNSVLLELLEKRKGRHDTYVFSNDASGQPWKDVWLGVKKACRAGGLSKEITWNTFRHTFETWLLRSGANIVTVKTLMGHSSIKVTERYLEEVFDDSRNAVRSLPAVGTSCDISVSRDGNQRV